MPYEIPIEFRTLLVNWERQAAAPKPGTREHFLSLDVQEGDRVRLTEKVRDGAVLEGVVLGLKEKDGIPQVRVKGFDHTGGNAGGQHVWFPVTSYKVEVLHRIYRLTDEDRQILAISGHEEGFWKSLSDGRREHYRQTWRPRLAKVKKALGITE